MRPADLVPIYLNGCFPMADETGEIGIYEPRVRCLFPVAGVHVSRRFARTLRQGAFSVSINQAFRETMLSCIRSGDEAGNWITDDLIDLYTRCHEEGWAHSVEVWRADRLVGGLYGLAIGQVFFAESMFHRETDMSKVALFHAVEQARAAGITVFDAQVPNPHLLRMGGYEYPQEQFVRMIRVPTEIPSRWAPGWPTLLRGV